MKKIKYLALVVAILMLATSLVGCNKIKLDDVKADPAAYVADAAELTLGNSPFAFLNEQQNKVKLDLFAKGEGTDMSGSVYFDLEGNKYSVDADLGDMLGTGEDTGFAAYFADKQLVVKSGLLESVLGTDAVGINFGSTLEDIKSSDLYKMLVSMIGMTEEEFGAEFDKIAKKVKIEDITKLLKGYISDIKALSEEQAKDMEAAEDTLKIGEKEYDVIVVTAKQNGDISAKIIDKTYDLAKSVIALAGEYLDGVGSEDDIKAAFDSVKDSLPKTSATVKYYISAKTGALLKVEGDSKSTVTDTYLETTEETEVKYDVLFGAEPEKEFLPKVKVEYKAGEEIYVFNGESSVKDEKFTFAGDLDIKGEFADNITFEYVIDKDGKFDLKLVNEDDEEPEINLSGKFVSEDNKIEFVLDLSKGYAEDEVATIKEIGLTATFGEDAPKLPKYKDVLDFTADELSGILSVLMMGGMDGTDEVTNYDASIAFDLMFYLELEDEEAVFQYCADNCASANLSESDYLYVLYINCVYSDLVENYGVAETTIDAYVAGVAGDAPTYYDMAVALYDGFFDLAMGEVE
ncbi:MAG: hypothetical protein IJ046_04345 [Clostridia bacterium]|nr:hypothetical protein [Clostridia bacterium]